MSDVTRILSQIEQGDPSAADQLLPLIYTELRRLAAAKMANESPDHTLQPTALVHEAYIRLVDREEAQKWDSRGHFFSAASEAMRRILVESVRRKRGPRQAGKLQRQGVDPDRLAWPETPDEVLAIDEALRELSRDEPKIAKLVELRYFAGLTLNEAAAAIGVSSRTGSRYWAYAKARLHHKIRECESD